MAAAESAQSTLFAQQHAYEEHVEEQSEDPRSQSIRAHITSEDRVGLMKPTAVDAFLQWRGVNPNRVRGARSLDDLR